MIKCPNCGSTAQIKLLKTNYQEDGWTIIRTDTYWCGCCCQFDVSARFESDGYEVIDNVRYPQEYDQTLTQLAYQMIGAINKKRGE